MSINLTSAELRLIASMLDRLDKSVAEPERDEPTGDYVFAGDVPIHVGETHMLVGYAENADGEGHVLRLVNTQ
jgi:hypothetical protein